MWKEEKTVPFVENRKNKTRELSTRFRLNFRRWQMFFRKKVTVKGTRKLSINDVDAYCRGEFPRVVITRTDLSQRRSFLVMFGKFMCRGLRKLSNSVEAFLERWSYLSVGSGNLGQIWDRYRTSLTFWKHQCLTIKLPTTMGRATTALYSFPFWPRQL